MSFLRVSAVVTIFISIVVGLYLYLIQPPPVPEIKLGYWAQGPPKPDDTKIKSFKVKFPQSNLKELQEKLALSRDLVPSLEGIGFEYGVNTRYMQEFLKYWRTNYSYTAMEERLNTFPHFKTQIGGLNIHFIHVKPVPHKVKGKAVVPLLLVHGWPGSVREFYDILPLLLSPQEDTNFVFEVIAPSLPGYGFSDAAVRPGMGPPQMAVIFAELMTRLGFQKFYYQGGDWGSVIGHALSVLFPSRVLGYHSNFCVASTIAAEINLALAYLFPTLFVEPDRIEFFQNQFFDSMILESGYYHIQATKPDTIGISLTDSPVGLAAYLLEKFSTATNKDFRSLDDGGIETMDKIDILDNIMIYWLTKSITTAMRLYSEHYVQEAYSYHVIFKIPNEVPTHCARFKHELLYYPVFALRKQYHNLISVSDISEGGHFAAMEKPQLLADDLVQFVKKVRSLKK